MPFYLENLLGQPDAIHEQGAFYLTYAGDRPLASIATRDIADAAAALLTDRSWAGQMNLPVFGPDRLTEMLAAQDAGLYDADWAAATPAVTNFRTWCEEVPSPAASA